MTARPTHYAVLGLQPHMLDSGRSAQAAAASSALVRQAYRRALLRYHPDRHGTAGRPSGGSVSVFTVDQVTEAWAVLADPARRRAYDRALEADRQGVGVVESVGQAGKAAAASGTMTGMEAVDLDDLVFDETAGQWSRSCRCGNDCGFVFAEADLEEEVAAVEAEAATAAAAAGSIYTPLSATTGELLVGCQDCSLWLCVHFAVMADDGDGD